MRLHVNPLVVNTITSSPVLGPDNILSRQDIVTIQDTWYIKVVLLRYFVILQHDHTNYQYARSNLSYSSLENEAEIPIENRLFSWAILFNVSMLDLSIFEDFLEEISNLSYFRSMIGQKRTIYIDPDYMYLAS